MLNSGAAQNNSAGDVDEIAGRNEIADDAKKDGHGLAREDIAGKENAGQDGNKRELHGFALRAGFTGNENTQRKRYEQVRQREQSEKQNAAVDRHLKNKTHATENQAKLGKAY